MSRLTRLVFSSVLRALVYLDGCLSKAWSTKRQAKPAQPFRDFETLANAWRFGTFLTFRLKNPAQKSGPTSESLVGFGTRIVSLNLMRTSKSRGNVRGKERQAFASVSKSVLHLADTKRFPTTFCTPVIFLDDRVHSSAFQSSVILTAVWLSDVRQAELVVASKPSWCMDVPRSVAVAIVPLPFLMVWSPLH